MDPLTIAALIIEAASKGATLAAQAIESSQAGYDAKALDLLDQAIAHFEDSASPIRAKLDATKAKVAQAIKDKFPNG